MARPGSSTSWAEKGVHFVAELIAAAEFEILVGGVNATHSLTSSHRSTVTEVVMSAGICCSISEPSLAGGETPTVKFSLFVSSQNICKHFMIRWVACRDLHRRDSRSLKLSPSLHPALDSDITQHSGGHVSCPAQV